MEMSLTCTNGCTMANVHAKNPAKMSDGNTRYVNLLLYCPFLYYNIYILFASMQMYGTVRRLAIRGGT